MPGVRELLAKQAEKANLKQEAFHQHQYVPPDYYGWRDEEDGILLELEADLDRQNKKARIKIAADDQVQDYLEVLPQEEIERILLEHKKKALLAKYAL